MDIISSGHAHLLELSNQLYLIILRSQRGMAITKGEERAKKDALIVELASSTKQLMAALSTSDSPSRVEDEKEVSPPEDPATRIARQEMLSDAHGLCLYAQGLLLYSAEGQGHQMQRAQSSEGKLRESVKKAPGHLPAWLLLSHLLWERGDVSGAIRTINAGLSFCEEQESEGDEEESEPCGSSSTLAFAHRVALQQLSMLVRQAGGSGRSQGSSSAACHLLQLGLDLASAAVRRDVSDGYSWYCLALAQLSSYLQLHTPVQVGEGENEKFGTVGRRAKLLKQVLASFSQAEGNGCAELGDLYFNRAIIHTYSQEFQLALQDFERAASLDRTLIPHSGAQVRNWQLTRL